MVNDRSDRRAGEILPPDDGAMAVEVRQLVRGLEGQIVADGHVLHVYRFSGDLVERMDVEELDGSS